MAWISFSRCVCVGGLGQAGAGGDLAGPGGGHAWQPPSPATPFPLLVVNAIQVPPWPEPKREGKAHWDHLLEEMAVSFACARASHRLSGRLLDLREGGEVLPQQKHPHPTFP